MKKFSVVFLAVLLMICMVSAGVFAENKQASDPSTLDGWKNWFGPTQTDTVNAGGVWTDKTVLDDVQIFTDRKITNTDGHTIALDNEDNFIITLSALANNKSIKGYSYVPTDTILVLDVSGSMSYNEVRAMVQATNDAIKRLLELNNHNRVGVILYSGNTEFGNSSTTTATVLLPLDRYQHGTNTFLLLSDSVRDDSAKVSVGPGVTNSNNQAVTQTSKAVEGGTYIQNGLYQAMELLLAADTTIANDETVQAGTTRIPIFVLMSDGAPTAGTSKYAAVATSNMGDGGDSTNEISFVTQLTAAYAKAKVDAHYAATTPLFYTLGLGVDDLDNEDKVQAQSILDPENSTEDINNYWDSLINDANGSITLDGRYSVTRDAVLIDVSQQQYTDEYFSAQNAADLIAAFGSIVDEIVLQSKYYPTAVDEDANYEGYVSFIDKLGENMEVKEVKGMVLGTTLFDGSSFAKCFIPGAQGGALGTTNSPTDLGNEFIWAVQERLGIEEVSSARALVNLAWTYGQLYYDEETGEYGNRISIYTDADGKYLGFYDEDFNETVPATAAYIVDTYGYIDTTEVEASLAQGNLLYVSVAVRTDMTTGDVTVLWDIPASMVPMLNREFTIEGEDLNNPGTITMESNAEDVSPLRLVYEVGLKSDINKFNVTEKVDKSHLITAGDDIGKYAFYTDDWDAAALEPGYELTPIEDPNTVSYFHPNEANERYYYSENTPVYVKDGENYVLYNSSTAPKDAAGTYYRQIKVFDWSSGTIELINYYEEIYTNALGKANSNSDGTWYIPMGTVRGLAEDEHLQVAKAANNSGTLLYSQYGSSEYEDFADGTHYYLVDGILGNNGKLTYAPAQGIKISKDVAVYDASAAEPEFTFTVTGDASLSLTGTYIATLVAADGTSSENPITFTNNEAQVTLKRGETVYLTTLPVGEYTVTESPAAGYELVSINGDAEAKQADVTVAAYQLSNAAFVNTFSTHGGLLLSKVVTHPFGADYVVPDGLSFKFNVNLGTGYTEPIEVAGVEVSPVNGVVSVDVKANSSVLISGIKDGTGVTVTEDLTGKSGFSLTDLKINGESASDGTAVTIDSAADVEMEYTNNYTPSVVSPVNVTLTGTKTLEGRYEWLESDVFTFKLESHDSGAWKEVATDVIASETESYDFTDVLAKYEFNAAGIYSFRVSEVKGTLGGVTYDDLISYFYIHVADKDMDGKYEIENVTGSTTTTITKNADINVYQLSVDFTNTYAASGSVDVALDLSKKIVDLSTVSSGISLQNNVFGLYTSDGVLVKSSEPTDAKGMTQIKVGYTAADLHQTYHYVIKEIIPENADPSIDYDSSEYPVSVKIVDNQDGTLGAEVTNADGSAFTSASFENKEVGDVFDKTVSGGQITVDNKVVAVGDVLTYTISYNNVNGVAANVVITDTIPAHTAYVENSASDSGVYADGKITWNLTVPANTEKAVTFDVKVTESAAVENTATAIINGHTIISNPVENKVYAPTSIELKGTKSLEGREMTTGEFEFIVVDAAGKEVAKGTNATDGTISFNKIEYSVPGEYTYTVKEVAKGVLGITYDSKTYEVKVVVTADAENKLSASATIIGADAIVFNNSYSDDDFVKTVGDENGDALISAEGIGFVAEGDVLTYDLTYTNNTGVDVKVTITDAIPTNTTYVANSASQGGSYDAAGNKVVWADLAVAKGESVKVSFKVTVNEISSDAVNSINNKGIANVIAGNETYDVTSNEVTTEIVDVPVKEVKQGDADVNKGTVAVGDILTYRISYTNIADEAVKVTITDAVPAGTEYVADSASEGSTVADDKLTWIFDNVAAGATVTASFQVKVNSLPEGETTIDPITNTATANVTFNNGAAIDVNTNEVTTEVVDVPKKEVLTDVADGEDIPINGKVVVPGEELMYVISYTNVDDKAAKVVITDTIPANTTYVEGSATENGVLADGKLTWTYDAVEPGATVKVSFKVKVNDTAGSAKITNEALVVVNDDHHVTSVPVENTVVNVPELEKAVSVALGDTAVDVNGKTVAVGDILTYTINYTNDTDSAVNVTITDAIPAGTEFVDAADGIKPVDGILTWDLKDVAAGSSVSVSFRVKVSALPEDTVSVDPVTNVAKGTVIYNGASLDVESNETTTEIVDVPEKTVLKDDVPLEGLAVVGDVLTYHISYSNVTDNSVKVTINDIIPAGTEFVKADSDITPVDGKLTWVFDDVAAGKIVNVSFSVKLTKDATAIGEGESASAPITNIAEGIVVTNNEEIIVKSNETSTDVVDNPYKTVFDAEGASVDGESVSYGEVLTYKIRYTNNTGGDAEVTITDKVPAYTIYEADSADNGGVYDAATGVITWDLGVVASGATVEVSFKVSVNEVAAIENQAVASIRKGDAVVESNKVTTTVDTILNRKDHFGYIIGYPEHYLTGEYTTDQTVMPVKPEGKITRAEVATIYFRMLTDEARTDLWTQENPYNDVNISDWFNNAVSVLTNAGILHGDPSGNFRPNDPITRAEFAAIASRFYQSACDCQNDHFTDISGHWAQNEINKAAHNALVNGYPETDGLFMPDEYIKRCEAVTIVNRTLNRAPDKEHFLPDMLVWPDNMDTEVWYYAEMQEATNSHEYEKLTDENGNVYEKWTKMLPIRDWAAFEREWSDANSAENPGEVVNPFLAQ